LKVQESEERVMPNADSAVGCLMLAPIRGVTDVVYRNAYAACFSGIDCALAPFFQLRQGHPLREGELRQVVLENNRAMRTIPQVLTHHAPTFSMALRELKEAGHEEVNWNLGCPYPTVAGRGRGAGLLPDATRIDAILDEVMSKTPVRLSVKMRLGYHDPDEFRAVIEVLNQYPLDKVILHPRTADQMYDGIVDVGRAREAMQLCRHPFVFNGDIASAEGFHDLRKNVPGIAAWMLGRGVLKNPFLPALITGVPLPPPDVRRQLLVKFHAMLFEGYGQWLSGPRHRLDKMMEQWEYLAHAFADPQSVYMCIRRSHIGTYERVIEGIFEQGDCP
jgi:tRNA-dihydrouridine synthase B